MKIFIPGAGGKISHILNFQELSDVKKVIISESDPWAYGNFVADTSYLLPRFDDSNFLSSFEKVFDKERFDVCIPIHDVSLYLFSKNRDFFQSFPFNLAINPKETIDIVADKLLTYDFFIKNDIPTADVYTIDHFLNLKTHSFPYYVKPRYIYLRGSHKQLYMKIEDNADVEYMMKKIKGTEKEFVIQEYLEGTEINIDFFCDSQGNVKSIIPLIRHAMGASRGISRGEIIFNTKYDSYVIKIAQKLKFWGANNVQLYVDKNNNHIFTEINGRFSGSSVLVKEAGVNFFHYFVQLLKGEDIEITEKPKYLNMCCWEKPFYFTDMKAKKL
jgi:carbamoyl-phosphate synthase large subunit